MYIVIFKLSRKLTLLQSYGQATANLALKATKMAVKYVLCISRLLYLFRI